MCCMSSWHPCQTVLLTPRSINMVLNSFLFSIFSNWLSFQTANFIFYVDYCQPVISSWVQCAAVSSYSKVGCFCTVCGSLYDYSIVLNYWTSFQNDVLSDTYPIVAGVLCLSSSFYFSLSSVSPQPFSFDKFYEFFSSGSIFFVVSHSFFATFNVLSKMGAKDWYLHWPCVWDPSPVVYILQVL